MKTLQEFKDDLKDQDQVEIIYQLEITTEDLLDRFDDWIEDLYNQVLDRDQEEDED